MTTALITTCDRCARQLGSKPAPAAPKPTSFAIAGPVSAPPLKQYDLCHVCAADFAEWLSGADRPHA